eukprot:4510452-Pleurochrysis_carterae.AAC.2
MCQRAHSGPPQRFLAALPLASASKPVLNSPPTTSIPGVWLRRPHGICECAHACALALCDAPRPDGLELGCMCVRFAEEASQQQSRGVAAATRGEGVECLQTRAGLRRTSATRSGMGILSEKKCEQMKRRVVAHQSEMRRHGESECGQCAVRELHAGGRACSQRCALASSRTTDTEARTSNSDCKTSSGRNTEPACRNTRGVLRKRAYMLHRHKCGEDASTGKRTRRRKHLGDTNKKTTRIVRQKHFNNQRRSVGIQAAR